MDLGTERIDAFGMGFENPLRDHQGQTELEIKQEEFVIFTQFRKSIPFVDILGSLQFQKKIFLIT